MKKEIKILSGKLVEIPCWKTYDGRVFELEGEAYKHLQTLEFEEWYSENTLENSTGSDQVEAEDMLEWLKDNTAMVDKVVNQYW